MCSDVRPDPKVTEKVNFPSPKTIRQVKSFFGLANYYCKFVSGYAKITMPINRSSFGAMNVRGYLLNPPPPSVLPYPNFEEKFVLVGDT